MPINTVPFTFRLGNGNGPTRTVPAAWRGQPRQKALTLTGAQIAVVLQSVVALRGRTKIPIGILSAARYLMLVNPQVATVAGNLTRALPSVPEVSTAAGVQPADLASLVDKLAGLTTLYLAAQRGQVRLAASRGASSQALRTLRDRIIAAARELLAVADLQPALRSRIQAAMAAVEQTLAKQKAAAQQQRLQSQAQTATTQAELDRLQTLSVLQQVITDVNQGSAVDPVLAAQALQLKDQLAQEQQAAAAAASAPAPASAPKTTRKKAATQRRSPGR